MPTDPDPFAPRPAGEPPHADPFAPDARTGGDGGAPSAAREPTIALADRDPHAREETAEHGVTGATSFDDVLRRARRQGFVAGCLAGGAAAAAFAAVTWTLVGTTSVPTREVRGERAERPVQAGAEPRELGSVLPGGAASETAPAAAPERPAAGAQRTHAAPGRATPSALEAAPTQVPAGADGREVAETSADPDAPALAPAGAEGAVAAPASAEGQPRAPGEREVMAALRARGEAIDECVALTPGHEAEVRGRRFRLLVVVEPGGEVSDAKVLDPDVEATPLGLCLPRLARELSFPSFAGERVRVEVPVRYGRTD